MMQTTLVQSAAQQRRGKKAKVGLVVRDDLRLEYDGSKDPHPLWADERFRLRAPVRVGTNRVMRTRPMFPEWSTELAVEFLPSLLNASEVRGFVAVVGEQVGVGDWRPRFGKFWADELTQAAKTGGTET